MASKRVQIYLTNREIEELDYIADQFDISRSEVIRRILDKYLEGLPGCRNKAGEVLEELLSTW